MGDRNLRSVTDGRVNLADVDDINHWLLPAYASGQRFCLVALGPAIPHFSAPDDDRVVIDLEVLGSDPQQWVLFADQAGVATIP